MSHSGQRKTFFLAFAISCKLSFVIITDKQVYKYFRLHLAQSTLNIVGLLGLQMLGEHNYVPQTFTHTSTHACTHAHTHTHTDDRIVLLDVVNHSSPGSPIIFIPNECSGENLSWGKHMISTVTPGSS